MPAKSKSQQRAMQMAYAAKRGGMSPMMLKGASKQMYLSMTGEQLADFAKGSMKGKPEHVKKKKMKKGKK